MKLAVVFLIVILLLGIGVFHYATSHECDVELLSELREGMTVAQVTETMGEEGWQLDANDGGYMLTNSKLNWCGVTIFFDKNQIYQGNVFHDH